LLFLLWPNAEDVEFLDRRERVDEVGLGDEVGLMKEDMVV